MYVVCCFFFFQAEDGIRDVAVTGVQTCALPIWPSSRIETVERGAWNMAIIEHTLGVTSLRERKLQRRVGAVSLMFVSVGTIIGSGWLLGALTASKVAGPAAIISWLIGAAVVLTLALVHAELGGGFPVDGGSARYPHYAFGSLVGFASGWVLVLGPVSTPPPAVVAGR